MRMFFRSILLILCLVLFTSGANTATLEFAGKYERDHPWETVSSGIIGTHNPPLRVCETKRPANPPQRDAGQAGTKSSTTKTASGVAMKFTRLSVKDPLAGNIEAVSFLIPAGWKAEGGVQWYPNHAIQANLLMKIVDPQTDAAIEFLPAQWFSWPAAMVVPMPQGSNYLGQIIWPPIYDVPEFIRTFYFSSALARLQNSKIVANENQQKLADQLSREQGGPPLARCARVRYEYQEGEQPWEEDVYITLAYTPMQIATYWFVGRTYSFRAHRGQLDRFTPVMYTTVNSYRMSPEWYGYLNYVRKLFTDRMAQGIRNAGRISDTITRNTAEIGKMYEDSYRKANESQDRISRSYSEYIRGVETYRNPYEDRPIQLPSGYDGVWVNRSGEYLLSNQPGFNPNVGSTNEWRRMAK
ncbi:MAG: hypothetical protein H6Q06_1172 [Acidobacteria bacterium]|nr:hypothetical protein [Acidobacteriota bacterium]